jgi:Ser/Thr protein kinase RdoA (MazF antagonist)
LVRTGDDRPAVPKYLRADRKPGETRWDAHWTVQDQDPRRWNYWAREPLAYQHHLTGVYAEAGIRAPACLVSHVDEREALLLLEWVDGQPGESWPVGLYGPTAEALGRAQAGFLVDDPLPAFPWLSRGFLRQYSSEKVVERELLDDDAAWQHPIAREVFPATLRDGARFLHANRERLCRISESLPRTLCHLDFWPKNLVRRAGGEVVLIDWAFVGLGSIAEDVGNLVPDTCFDHFISAEYLPELA